MWLKDGHWTPYPVIQAMHDYEIAAPARSEFLGYQKIIDWALGLPVVLLLIIIGLAAIVWGVGMAEAHEQIRPGPSS